MSDLSKALYDDNNEATGRIAVDFMIIACKLYVMASHPTHFANKRRMVAGRLETPQDFEEREQVKVYPEIDLGIDVLDPKTNENICVSGRADWGFGYSGRDGATLGTFLVAVEAKKHDLWSSAEPQLLTYLAILRQLRIKAGKTNAVSQGFYTDGYRYCFMAIKTDGNVEQSDLYNVRSSEGLKSIFNFIIAILESAIRSSPTVSPIKAAEQRETEINQYTGEVWSTIYDPYQLDEEEGDFIDLPPLKP